MQTATCDIRLATPDSAGSWDRYVLSHPQGTIFHSTAWQRVIENAFSHKSHYLAAFVPDTQEIVGVLPLFEIKSILFDHYLVSVPFAELGGVLADNQEVATALTTRAIELSAETGVAYLELKNRQPYPGLLTKALYFNFSRPICSTTEENLLTIPRKSRAMVRRGIKAGLKAEWGKQLLDEFYLILAKSYHRLGTPIFPKRLFHAFLDEFADCIDLMVVRKPGGEGIAAVMTFFYRDRVMPYYAGSLAEYRELASNDFMYWVLMEYGREHGFTVFDFGRSKAETGSYHFKKNWGFEPLPLAYQYHLANASEMPNLSPANPKYRRKIELWRKLPFCLTRFFGPPLAKYLA